MQVLTDDGTRVDVLVDGSGGTPIVMLAGFALSREIWNPQIETLSRRARVLRPELRGMGTSPASDGPYLMETLAGDVAAVLDRAGVERAAIVGHSLGGYVALAFARMFCERVERLALVCSRLAADTPEQAAVRYELADRAEREQSIEPVVASYLPRMLSAETAERDPALAQRVGEMMRRTNPAGAAAMLRGMAVRSPSDDIAPELDMPVLVVAGARDVVIPNEEAAAVAAAFPRARLEIAERSGHLPMLEEPGALAGTLERFLADDR